MKFSNVFSKNSLMGAGLFVALVYFAYGKRDVIVTDDQMKSLDAEIKARDAAAATKKKPAVKKVD